MSDHRAIERGKVIEDGLQDLGFKTRGTDSGDSYWLHVYKSGRKVAVLQVFADYVDVLEEVKPGTAHALLKPFGVKAPVTKEKVSWQGIYFIEGKLNTVRNKLAFIITRPELAKRYGPSREYDPDPKRDAENIEEAVQFWDRLTSQVPPASARKWYERALDDLERSIERAFKAIGRSWKPSSRKYRE